MIIDNSFKCDACGCFISYKDLSEGVAEHKLLTPDSHYTSEQWLTLCGKCKNGHKNS